jgi:twinkle protein
MSDDLKEILDKSEVRALSQRKITQATAQKWDYRGYVDGKGQAMHVAVYRDETGAIVAAKVRDPDKVFFVVGELPPLYGMQFLGNGGKKVILVEGEIDALSVSQVIKAYPVVSIPKGAPNAKKDVAKVLDRLCAFDEVVICFDQDEPGRKAAEEVARMLPPGKASIATLSRKDPNEMLQAGETDALINALFHPTPFSPDGIVDADDVDGELDQPVAWGSPYAYDFLTEWTYGRRPGEVYVLGAGTGVGKSDWEAEEVANIIKPKEDGGCWERCAVFNYEASAKVTLRGILGKLWSKRFHIPNPKDGSPNIYWNNDELLAARAYRRTQCAKLFINDAKGKADWPSVMERLRYLRHAFDIKHAFVDPVAAVAAGQDDERKALDNLFAEAKGLAEELEISITFLSHLTRPKDGKGHEEGGRVTLSQFRGSNAIGMWASFVFGIERDQQGDEEDRTSVFRCLKDRYTGDSTGHTQALHYNTLTGRLELAANKMDDPQQDAAPPPPFEGHSDA